jgi:surfactin synthase thioesterase subunit
MIIKLKTGEVIMAPTLMIAYHDIIKSIAHEKYIQELGNSYRAYTNQEKIKLLTDDAFKILFQMGCSISFEIANRVEDDIEQELNEYFLSGQYEYDKAEDEGRVNFSHAMEA